MLAIGTPRFWLLSNLPPLSRCQLLQRHRINLRFAFTVQIQLVLGVLILERWLQETISPVHRQADARLQIQTVAVGAGQALNVVVQARRGIDVLIGEIAGFQITVKAHQLGLVIEIQTFRVIRQLTIEGDLRQTIVRRDVRNGCQLILLGIQPSGIAVTTIGHRALLIHVVAGLHTNLIGLQILEVIRIADLGVVNLG
jgi:hypothetical protein